MDYLINKMQSADYKDRFYAEYWQTKQRSEKLHSMIVKYEAGTLSFTPSCPIEILKEQEHYMLQYLFMLEVRASIEKINLLVTEDIGK